MPAASGIYIVFSLIVIFSCYDRIPGALASMVSSAFCPGQPREGEQVMW